MAGFGSKSKIIAGKAFILIEAMDKTPKVLKRVQANFMRMGANLQQMGATLLTRSMAALTPSGLALRRFADFDDSMRKVQARSQGTSKELAKVRKQALELGRTTSFTASQIAELQAILAQRGFNRTQIFDMTPGIMALARGAGTGDRQQDIASAADLVTGALRAYGLEAKDSMMAADLFTAAVNNSNFSLVEMIHSLSNVGPIAKLYNMSLAETVGLLGSMRNVNIDPSVAGTGLRNIFLKASDEKRRTKFNDQLAEMTGKTISFVDAAGNLRGIPSIMFSVFDALEGLGTAQQGDILSELFGLRAIVPAGALIRSKEAFEELMDVESRAGNLALETAKLMDSGLGGAFRILLSATEGIAMALGEALVSSIIGVAKNITELQTRVAKWIENNHELINQIHVAIITVGIFGAILIGIGLAVKFIAFAMSPFIALLAIAFVGVKILTTVFIAAIGVLTTLISLFFVSPMMFSLFALIPLILLAVWIKASSGISKAVTGIKNKITSFFKFMASLASEGRDIGELMVRAIMGGDLELAFAVATEGIKLLWLRMMDFMITKWQVFIRKIKDELSTLLFFMAKWSPVSDDVLKRLGNLAAMMGARSERDEQSKDKRKRHTEIQAQIDILKHLATLVKAPIDVNEEIDKILSKIPGVSGAIENLVRPAPKPAAAAHTNASFAEALQAGSVEAFKAFSKAQQDGNKVEENLDQQMLNQLGHIERNTRNLKAVGGV